MAGSSGGLRSKARTLINDVKHQLRKLSCRVHLELDEYPFGLVFSIAIFDSVYHRLTNGGAHPVHRMVVQTPHLPDVVVKHLPQLEHVEVARKLQPDRMSVFGHARLRYSATDCHASVTRRSGGHRPLLYSSRMDDAVAVTTTIEPGGYVHGTLCVPGDKSISHRYAILATLAEGQSSIHRYAPGADCATTLSCLQSLGATIESHSESQKTSDRLITIDGAGAKGLRPIASRLNAGNSGTTMRLIAGVLAARPFNVTIVGDASLNKRPMRRIVNPLERMGARVETHDGCPPLTIRGTDLRGLDYEAPVASAQVKSAVLLAGLHARGETWVRERVQTRDHTERALPVFGVHLRRRTMAVGLSGGQRLAAATLTVPGDFSSAAYWFVAAAALPGSAVKIADVGLNPTRTRLLDILADAGASVLIKPGVTASSEPFGTVTVAHRELRPIVITEKDVPALIDELPALAALGTAGRGFRLSGAAELRTKESDRIAVLVSGLRQMGAQVDEHSDGFEIYDGQTPSGGTVDASGDHRMAMAFAIAALGATGPTRIKGSEAVDVSYPGFFDTLDALRQT